MQPASAHMRPAVEWQELGGKFQSWNSHFLTAADYVDHQDAGADADVCADAGADAGVGHAENLAFSCGVNISQS